MGTGYTTGADTWKEITWLSYPAQSFRVLQLTFLHYIELYLYKGDEYGHVRCEISEADPSGHPTSNVKAVAIIRPSDFPPGQNQAWITKTLTPSMDAYPEKTYVITLTRINEFWYSGEWAYDSGDATYPYGIRLSTEDKGETWTDHISDDHLFFIWGTPPAPPPPPPPPDDRWALLNIEQQIILGGYKIVLTTDRPCHLWLYWSNHPPWVHREATTRRGLTLPWDAYWCYVAWHKIEQQEPGDTLIHTFTWGEWQSCQTKYFRFHGTIGGVESPSDSPIFSKHYPFLTTFTTSVNDGWVFHKSLVSYLTARDALAASEINFNEVWIQIGQRKIGATYLLWRGLLYFDLTAFPYLNTLKDATIELNPRQNLTPQDFLITISPAEGTSSPPIDTDYRLILDQFEDFGSFPTAGQEEGYGTFPCLIPLNKAAIRYIKSHPLCHLALVSSKDIAAIPPTDSEKINFWSANYWITSAPRLHLFYDKP